MKALTIALAALLAGVIQVSASGVASKSVAEKTGSAEDLRRDMRKLWSDQAFWMRDYIIAAVAAQPDEGPASARLLKNQEHIGSAIGAYYGKDAGEKLTGLMKEHMLVVVDITKSSIAHDQARFQQADQKAARNAEDIADFLSKANPNWPKPLFSDMLKTELSTTKNEVSARVSKNWDDDVKAFDAAYEHILKMSDALADGIVKQFPEKFPH